MVCRRGERAAGRDRRPGLPRGLRLEGVPAHGSRVRRRAAAAPARERPAARADPHARDEGRVPASTTSTSTSSRWSSCSRTGRPTATTGSATTRRSPLAERVRDVALRLYELGAARCAAAGIILADTKFEMGLVDGELILVDEVLTPDSSRFWDAATYEPGRPQASFDKQFVRDWLETQPWDKAAPGPELPRRGRRRHARPVRRGVRADHRRELRALPARRTSIAR